MTEDIKKRAGELREELNYHIYRYNVLADPVITDAGPANDTLNKVVRFRALVGRSGGANLIKVLARGHDKLFARRYLKYEPTFNFSAANHGGGLAAGDRNFVGVSGSPPNGSDFAGFYIQYHANNGGHHHRQTICL